MNNENQNPYGDQSQEDNPWGNDHQNFGGNQSQEQNDPWGNNNQNPWGNQSDQPTNPWANSQSMIDNPYLENPYEANFFDNPYTETFANPNPENEQDSGWEI